MFLHRGFKLLDWSHQTGLDFHAGLRISTNGDDGDFTQDGFPHNEGRTTHNIAVDGLSNALTDSLDLPILRTDAQLPVELLASTDYALGKLVLCVKLSVNRQLLSVVIDVNDAQSALGVVIMIVHQANLICQLHASQIHITGKFAPPLPEGAT